MDLDLTGLLTTEEAAAYLGWESREVLWVTANRDPTFPRPVKIGRASLYRVTELDAWRAAHPARTRNHRDE